MPRGDTPSADEHDAYIATPTYAACGLPAPTESARTGPVPYPKEEPCDDGWRSPAPCSRWPRPSRVRRRWQRATEDSRPRRPSMLTDVKDGCHRHAAPDRRRRVRGHASGSRPSRTGSRWTRRPGRVDLYVNHETSKVPFPFGTATADGGQRGERLRQFPGQPAHPEQGRPARSTAPSSSPAAPASSGSAPTTSPRARRIARAALLFT